MKAGEGRSVAGGGRREGEARSVSDRAADREVEISRRGEITPRGTSGAESLVHNPSTSLNINNDKYYL